MKYSRKIICLEIAENIGAAGAALIVCKYQPLLAIFAYAALVGASNYHINGLKREEEFSRSIRDTVSEAIRSHPGNMGP